MVKYVEDDLLRCADDTALFSTDHDDSNDKKKLELAISWCKTNSWTFSLKRIQWIVVKGPLAKRCGRGTVCF